MPDFVQGISPQELRALIRNLGEEIEVVSIYACGGWHVAWYRKKVAKVKADAPHKKNDLKGN